MVYCASSGFSAQVGFNDSKRVSTFKTESVRKKQGIRTTGCFGHQIPIQLKKTESAEMRSDDAPPTVQDVIELVTTVPILYLFCSTCPNFLLASQSK